MQISSIPPEPTTSITNPPSPPPLLRHIHMLATPIVPSLLFYTENYLLFLFLTTN